jgi:lipoate---protein ligase
MQFLDLTLPTLAANLALDEALLLAAEAGGAEAVRLWECPQPAVILGAGGRWHAEAIVPNCERDRVPILRRSSGGGAVLLGPGCLLFSLVLAYDRHPAFHDLHASYQFILEKLAEALDPIAPGIAPAGISDLVVAGKKCAGNSQQRKRTHFLHHGSLLCSFDLVQIPRYLAHPPREPDYRAGRTHLDFVTNLNVPIAQAKDCLKRAWDAKEAALEWPEDFVNRLFAEKYNRPEWHCRR